MHRRRRLRALPRACLALGLSASAIPAQQFDELVGRGLPREVDDTAVVALHDFDGDGHVDLLFGALDAYPGRPLQLRLGSPDGIFTVAPAGALPARLCLPAALVCADFDGDGDLDVLVANRDFLANVLFVNDGTGRFTDVSASRLPASNADSRAAAAADVDGDGDLDVLVANALGPDRLLLNDGAGSFTLGPALPDPPGDDPTAIAFVDVDGDGDLDVAVTNARGQNRFWRNLGAAQFADVTAAVLPVDIDVSTAAVAVDVDGDGDLDLVIGNRGAPDRLYRNDGTGRFTTDPTWTPPVGGQTVALAVLDADGDGDPDVAVARFGEPNQLLRNDGTGALRAAVAPWPLQHDHTNAVAVADVDGDGDPDLVFGNGRATSAPGRKQLLLNDGTGVFTSATAQGWAAPDVDSRALAVGDLDGDGTVDVAVGVGPGVETWFGDGYGGLGGPRVTATGVQPDVVQALALGDVDGDGDLDVVVGTSSSNVVLTNDGTGALAVRPAALPPGSFDTRALLLVDVDGDGDLDVVEANAGSSPQFAQQNRLLVNDGSGTFTDATATALPAHGDFTFGVAAADVDGDGDLDLLFANWSVPVPTAPRQPNRLLLNDGAGRFADAPAGQLPLDDDPTAAAAFGDLDGDGDLDLVTGNVRVANRVYRNDGTGTFAEDLQALPRRGDPTCAVVLADHDGDGDLDVFFGNDGAPNGLFRNDGPGGFVDASPTAWSAFPDATEALAVVDVDGDGDLDVVVANGSGQADRLLFCLTRHVDVPYLIRDGRDFAVEVYARPAAPGMRAHLWIAFRDTAPVPVFPFGALRLDPAVMVSLGEVAVPLATGRGEFRFVMPAGTSLIGAPLFFQALLYAPTAPLDARLTNPVRRVIGS